MHLLGVRASKHPLMDIPPLLRSYCLYSLLFTRMMKWMYNSYKQAAGRLPALEQHDTTHEDTYTNNDLGDVVYPSFGGWVKPPGKMGSRRIRDNGWNMMM